MARSKKKLTAQRGTSDSTAFNRSRQHSEGTSLSSSASAFSSQRRTAHDEALASSHRGKVALQESKGLRKSNITMQPWRTVFQSLSNRLSDLHDENAEVLRRATRTQDICATMARDVASALSRLQADEQQRDNMQKHLKQERDELAKEVAALRERLSHAEKEHHATTPSPVSIVEGSGVGLKSTSLDDKDKDAGPQDGDQETGLDDGNEGVGMDTIATAGQTWICSACCFLNPSSQNPACKMCGNVMDGGGGDGEATVAASPVSRTAEGCPLVSMLLEMGYESDKIDAAIHAFGGAERAMPEAVIAWIEEHKDKAVNDDNDIIQERLRKEKMRLVEKERRKEEERLARREAKKQSQKEARERERALRDAKESEEQQAREAEERRTQEIEEQRAKEAEERRAREIEEQRAREVEKQRTRDVEEQRRRAEEAAREAGDEREADKNHDMEPEASKSAASFTSGRFSRLGASLGSSFVTSTDAENAIDRSSAGCSAPPHSTDHVATKAVMVGSSERAAPLNAPLKLSQYLYPNPKSTQKPTRKPGKESSSSEIGKERKGKGNDSLSSDDDSDRRKDKGGSCIDSGEGQGKGSFSIGSDSDSDKGNESKVSPIFDLLCDERTTESARTLLSLEDRCAKLKKEAEGIRSQRESNGRNIVELAEMEAGLDDQLKATVQWIERAAELAQERRLRALTISGNRMSKKAIEQQIRQAFASEKEMEQQIQRLKQKKPTKIIKQDIKNLIESKEIIDRAEEEEQNAPRRIQKAEGEMAKKRARIEGKINKLKDETDECESKLNAVLKSIEKERNRIEQIKGLGKQEDAGFDINGSRNEHGQTFLMVAVQNDDLETAQLCFRLGASPTEKCPPGLTAMFFAQYFKLDKMANLIAQNGGSDTGGDAWDALFRMKARTLHAIDWETQLRIAEKAAVPADTKLCSAEDSGSTPTSAVTTSERGKDIFCFDASLADPEATNFRRVVLMEKQEVYCWFLEADAPARSSFVHFLRTLQAMGGVGRSNAAQISCHSRFIVGVKREKQFEVLCAPLNPVNSSDDTVTKDALVAFFSPFVESEIHGVASIGVLLWAVTIESKASQYGSLIESAEFRRHKFDDPSDRFPAHKDDILELGKDMHLLDLKGTSIFSGNAMELLVLDIDEGELELLGRDEFAPTKRLLDYDRQLQNAIFRSSEKESRENQGILSKARTDLSSNIFGGAGTGKTLLMIKKVVSESPDKKILVVSRLSRLVSMVKSAVEAERDASNVSFCTYDELLTVLARRVHPSDDTERRVFSAFSEVHFGDTSGTGAVSSISFLRDFVGGFLEELERKAMKANLIEPITLWSAFRIIKSNVKCSLTKAPLTEEEYMELPRSFGLNKEQRRLVYKIYGRYVEWLNFEPFKWDEADRVLYTLRHGHSVFSESDFVSWEERAYQRGEIELIGNDDMPLGPFFYHMVFADEAQDFSELDLALFIRMSSSLRSLFLGADPAQSVELGIRMRVGTVNGAFHSCLPKFQKGQVKNVLQDLHLKINHRTHAGNLEIAKAVRKILTRSFGVPMSDENALLEGAVPEALLLKTTKELGDENKFRGGNIVFITPDEMLPELRSIFLELGIKNDAFGIREAKGLEFPSIAVIGFFSYFEKLGSARQWENVIRWLFSSKGITTTESSEKISGQRLEQCDYVLSNPEIEDQAMMLYTAMTRARRHLYFIEVEDQGGKKRKNKGGLADFAFRHFKQLHLLKLVSAIDEGEVDMTPQQHKARGVLLVIQAINLSRNLGTTESVKEKFAEAASRFQPDKGRDQHLLDECNKHLEAILMKRELVATMKTKFFSKDKGEYDLGGRFTDVLEFERNAAKFFRLCANDSFLVDEIHELRSLIEDVFYGTPYEVHFGDICSKIRKFES